LRRNDYLQVILISRTETTCFGESIIYAALSVPTDIDFHRPEAVESVWYMYRITGDTTWMDKGWKMFQATIAATRTEFANSAIEDVTDKTQNGLKDEMESFWISETLKYYYLLFSEPNVISLDEWVLNTEAHPFKRSI
jgi:mannosyl-oligosaccharide alpha-1,2-mannosidase